MRKFLTICIIGISAALILAGCSNEAQTSLTDIQTAYANQDYDSAMDEIDNFKTLYAEKDPELLAEVEKISSNIEKSLFEKISSQNSAEDIETACNEYLDHFPNGQYIDSVNSRLAEAAERKAIEDINTAKEKIRSGELAEAKSMLDNIVSNDSISENITSQAQKLINTIKNTPATDFEITGGSSNVYLISEKNYGVICPYCGYKSGAMGSSSIYMELKKHYPGEIETSTNTFMCASAFQGGCREFSKYNLTIEYK